MICTAYRCGRLAPARANGWFMWGHKAAARFWGVVLCPKHRKSERNYDAYRVRMSTAKLERLAGPNRFAQPGSKT